VEDLLQEYNNIISPPCMKVFGGTISMDCILSFHSSSLLLFSGKRSCGIGN
jgi:hypothetical protein